MSKGKTASSTIVFVVSVLGIIVGLNVISTRFFKRFDMTADRVYTLSGSSKDLVKTLPDRLNIKLFVSEELTPQKKTQAQFAQDLLSEYEAYSEGKLHLEVVKMKPEETEKEKAAKDCKVQKLTRGERSKNKLEIASSYLGICFDYHGQIESISAIEQAEGLEFEISGLIKQMTVKKRKVAFSSSDGALLPIQGVKFLSEQLKKSGYDVITVDLQASIPDDVDGLLIVGPKQKCNDRAKYVVDQFLMKGKSLAFFIDGETMSTPKGDAPPGVDLPEVAQASDTGFEDLIAAYGIKINHDLVLDKQNEAGPVPYAGQMLGANHPVFVAAAPFPSEHAITTGMEMAIFPFVSSLELVNAEQKQTSNVTYVLLAKSSTESWIPSGLFIFDPLLGKRPVPTDVKKGPFGLAYAASGKFKSFFAGKPAVPEQKTQGVQEASAISLPEESPIKESKESARLVVVASSKFISDLYIGLVPQGLQKYLANLQFGLNVVDWMAQDEGLASVRNKGMQNRPLKDISPATTNMIKLGNMIGVPVIVCLLGVVRWLWRRSRRNQMKLKGLSSTPL